MSPTRDLERLAGLYRQMLSLGQTGLDLLKRDDLEAWEDLWARRRQLQRQAQALQLGLKPLWAAWPAGGAGADAGQTDRRKDLLAEIHRIGREVLVLDRQAAETLEQQHEALRDAISRLGQGSRRQRAYRQALHPAAPQPLQLSRTG